MNFTEFSAPIEKHTELNPKLWSNGHLKPEVKKALENIAVDFKNYIDVPFTVVDVIVAGGNANYNYTEHSDIDLHLIADFDSVNCDREAAELFDSKRLLYKEQHDINIYGIPVELYVEDQRTPAVSSSYSIVNDQWVKEPSPEIPEFDQGKLEHMVNVWSTVIDHSVKTKDLQTCRNTLKLLRSYRKLGLKNPEGEFSIPNLVYKSLRNDGTLKGIQKLIDKLHDQQLSIG
jgi:hypothetical protein